MRMPSTSAPPPSRPRPVLRAALAVAVVAGLFLTSPGPAAAGTAADTTPAGTAPGTAPVRAREAHVANPYVGARGYVNPQWRARAEAEPGGSRVADTPTGIWLDRVSAIGGTADAMGLRAHLDAAVAQGANLVQVVLDDLPGRDCSPWNYDAADFGPGELARYEREFVDPIVAIESDPKYGSVRIVNVVERNALAQLVIDREPSDCHVQASTDHVEGIRYALDQLHAFSNLYTYLGIGGRAWLGWEENAEPATDLFVRTARGTAAGLAGVDGFISNLADYVPLTEPFLDARQTVGGQPIKMSKWVDWNPYVDELPFVTAFRARLVAAGFDAGIGVLVDTSRNGWGGPGRPTKASTATTLDTYVDASRVDRRPLPDEWCNQTGAGLGERPAVAPAAGIDAYVWMKPPGTSDGYYSPGTGAGPSGDARCRATDPRWYSGRERPSGAIQGAPPRGDWFPVAFRQLLANAYPPLP